MVTSKPVSGESKPVSGEAREIDSGGSLYRPLGTLSPLYLSIGGCEYSTSMAWDLKGDK
jgi:hypothetical protein